MRVGQRLVGVLVLMGLGGVYPGGVRVLVVLVVGVRVRVGQRLMGVLVLVLLREVQPHPNPHQEKRRNKEPGDRLSQEQERREGPNKRSKREVGSGASCSNMTQ